MTRIAILGAGTAGTIMANRLAKRYRRELARGELGITVVDQDNRHIYQPGLLFVPFGIYDETDLVKPRCRQLDERVDYVVGAIDRVEPDADLVHLVDGRSFAYDALIVATGVTTAPEETEGMTGPGWRERVFDFYTLEGATALRGALERFEGGRLVVNITDMPIKCPVAPLEFAFLADWYFTRRGIRDRVDIAFVTPLDSAFTKPICARELTHFLREKRIELVTEFNTGSVDGAAGRLVSFDEREVPFDLLVTVPLHAGAQWVGRSEGLGDDLRFVRVNQRTLQSERKSNIFALGDASNVPTSKAGSVAHFQAEVLEENVARFLDGKPLRADFDGHANCFIETGFGKALLIDFNYDVQPLPGRFPIPHIGPLRLLEESRLNHWGKLAFRWIYWNLLLPGHDMPLVSARMSMRGKHGFNEQETPAAEPATA
ncbi:MAG TPA: FAD/NAD(P)-binding oxidoreductase [Gemmatimonadales bacterium]|nr:FAD/NAD(P)-binding oxidoreductase [Gemmatimonadales bacterium]